MLGVLKGSGCVLAHFVLLNPPIRITLSPYVTVTCPMTVIGAGAPVKMTISNLPAFPVKNNLNLDEFVCRIPGV